jgi:hypothetical protein
MIPKINIITAGMGPYLFAINFPGPEGQNIVGPQDSTGP